MGVIALMSLERRIVNPLQFYSVLSTSSILAFRRVVSVS
jgi:hypothetical protein